jgi:2-polyprenyl-3-methyl-5-hydroxy-6-metoxy-1,4-benzoquinol methylase
MNTEYFDARASVWDQKKERAERAGIIYKKIISLINVNANSNLLDFGCGTGLLGFNFIGDVKTVTFADTSDAMLEQVNKKAAEKEITNYQIKNSADNSELEMYDAVVSLLALHHIENIQKTVGSLAACIKPDGYIALSDLDIEDGSFHYPEVAPHNGIDRNEILVILEQNNCKMICNEVVYTNEKIINGRTKKYPIFLIIGKKQQQQVIVS